MYILGIFDNPNDDLEELKNEQLSFQESMGVLMDSNEKFKYEAINGQSLEKLMDLIDERRDKLNWFHFSGHHDQKNGIRLNDGNFSTLVEHLERCGNLMGVFINGCASKETLDKLSDKVPLCIGTYKPVYDGIATKFSERFYKKLKSIESWSDFDLIHKEFEAVRGEVINLYKEKRIEGVNEKVRGGGSQQEMELENNFYFISEKSEDNKRLFIRKSTYVYNKILTKELMLCLKEKETHAVFLKGLFDKEHWEEDPGNRKSAQAIIVDSYIAVIGEGLRRLFVIGDEKNDEEKVETYLENCFRTYRNTLQLTIYLFISMLWDEKKKNDKILSKEKLIWNFFHSNKQESLTELRELLQLLIGIFNREHLTYPIETDDLGNIDELLDSDSDFNKACSKLEDLAGRKTLSKGYGTAHCSMAEESLAIILSRFKFYANYQLITIKKIEYEQSRYSGARYIKEIKLLDYLEGEDTLRVLEFDQEAEPSYTVKFTNGEKNVYLFPFLLDFNALINADKPHLYFFESLHGENGINYWSIEDGKEKTIFYEAAEVNQYEEIEDEVNKDKLQKKIRLDLVTKHFEKASNTLLGTDFEFKSKGKNTISKLKALRKK